MCVVICKLINLQQFCNIDISDVSKTIPGHPPKTTSANISENRWPRLSLTFVSNRITDVKHQHKLIDPRARGL